MGARIDAVAWPATAAEVLVLKVTVCLLEIEQVEKVVHVAVVIENVEDLLLVTGALAD